MLSYLLIIGTLYIGILMFFSWRTKKQIKTSSDFNSATAIKSILDNSILNLDASIQEKASLLTNDLSQTLANFNAQIAQSGSISQIATVQKVALDDEGSFLTSLVDALTQGLTSLSVLSLDSILTAAKQVAISLDINVAPYLSLDALVQVKENIIAGDGILVAGATDPEGDSFVFSLSGADAELFEIDADGKISFKASPNYTNPMDSDTDNMYMVMLSLLTLSVTLL